MYDCDKGFILGERGPQGATCFGGLWRPTELPSCLPGLHPRLRWNRRKRSLQIRKNRSQYLLRNIRQMQRKLAELLNDMYTEHNELVRNKRTIFVRRRRMQPMYNNIAYRDWASSVNRLKRSALNNRRNLHVRAGFMQRDRRNHGNIGDSAYDRYFQLLKQNHIDYIQAMFRLNQDLNKINVTTENLHHLTSTPSEHSFSHLKGRPSDRVENHKHKIIGNELLPNEFNEHNHHFYDNHEPENSYMRQFNTFPIPFPNINENLNDPQSKKLDINPSFANNSYTERKSWKFSRENVAKNVHRSKLNHSTVSPQIDTNDNESDLKVVRRKKRNTDEDLSGEILPESDLRQGRRRKFNHTMYDNEDISENNRKGRSREPCEVHLIQNMSCNKNIF